MKWTPFLSHWEEQRHLLVWVGLGRDKSFADRIPIGKFIFGDMVYTTVSS